MQQNQLEALLWGYFNKTLNEQQRQELFALIRSGQHQQYIEQFLQQLLEQQQDYPEHLDERTSNEILQAIQQLKKTDTRQKKPGGNIRMYRWMYAVAAAILVVAAAVAIFRQGNLPVQRYVQQVNSDIPERRYGAILTLPPGRQVVFDKQLKDTSFISNDVEINMKHGVLYFNRRSVSGDLSNVQYTVTTPRGRQFSLVMPDGTKVWLNAASAVSFQGFGNNAKRAVTVAGEAFFDVNPVAQNAFSVQTGSGIVVQVLGTCFNINAYLNEPAHVTTLINGKIKLVKGERNVVMHPGEQAIANNKTPAGLTLLKGVDTAGAVAWTKGLFNFKGITIEALGRQIERWYNINVEVDAESSLHEIKLGGSLSQDIPLADLMTALESFGIHSKIVNNHLLISAGKPR
ncbi:FecR family protein [Filimonas effusa]|uniref:DUF4974 domain-containing protein n=1 Tax=Filimonas effusa TaxID=2508721 RepID=A0A4Q1CZK2_9BACT|nr:FecR domain-containing protein [Filimonas effusa]RXK80837.1 DUF4974 domain-containing protein [Filimonas effusa]